jgi:hypothetical protein
MQVLIYQWEFAMEIASWDCARGRALDPLIGELSTVPDEWEVTKVSDQATGMLYFC